MASLDYAKLAELCPLPVVLDILGWNPCHRQRAGLRGWCPIHSSHPHDSNIFSVSFKGEWYCWKCKVGGGPLQLWQRCTDLPLRAACVLLAERAGVPVPWYRKAPRRGRARNKGEAIQGGARGASPPRSSLNGRKPDRISPLPEWWPV